MEKALRALLASSAAVTALAPLSRISWGLLPQGTHLPALSLHLISQSDEGLHMQGAGGLWRYKVQIDCYGADLPSVHGLASAVRGLLHGYRAGAFRLILLDARRDDTETEAALQPQRISLDFNINYQEA